ncbi:MAG TPA: glycine cleavage system aminomethyltransferase GcvT [Mycobacteriales bacterium]|jgi:aminomethyltransferase|nr:glycine cleavage system aminomethyltransferase GcvT [Mycobacteriales bacterium]
MTAPLDPHPPLQHSPLHGRHVALGAKMGDFGGWEMPIQYAGVLEEHAAVRERVGIFDVSHLGKGVVRGAGSVDFVNDRLTNDLRRVGVGQAQYTLCCDDATGGVVDDLIAYVRSEDEVFLIPNAANTSAVVGLLAADAPEGIEVADLHRTLAVLAVQGPGSTDVVQALGLPTDHDYMSFAGADWNGLPVIVCRTGYTGERGYELLPRWADAEALWDAVLAQGVAPCGLGARDTLRTEMGYPLHGQDLSLEITPVQARSSWAVGWDKPRFWGREVLLREREQGPARRLRGLEALDRGIPRAHMQVSRGGAVVGEVTSGTFSPTRRVGIGLALLEAGVPDGAEVTVDVRGRTSTMRVVTPPFVPSRVR